MTTRGHHSDYDSAVTQRCERVLVTLLGDLGPWRERIYLVGGPRLATWSARCPLALAPTSARPMSIS